MKPLRVSMALISAAFVSSASPAHAQCANAFHSEAPAILPGASVMSLDTDASGQVNRPLTRQDVLNQIVQARRSGELDLLDNTIFFGR